MITAGLRRIARAIPPGARTRIHDVADRFLEPFGSVIRAERQTHMVALTFDDGPHPEVTPRLLDLLRARGTSATFFVLTDYASKHPELIRRMVVEGHEVALHSDRHDRLTELPRATVKRRLGVALRSLEEIAGQRIIRYRPPYGSQTIPTIALANKLGLETVVWGPAAEDWIEQSPREAADRLLSTVKGGDITLLHDGLEVPDGKPAPTFDRVEMVDLILTGLEERGLEGVSVARMVEAAGGRKTFWVRS